MNTTASATSITEREREQIERANAATAMPVIFIHGLWLLPSSWGRWAALFDEAGYIALTPDWPGDPQTVEEARANPAVFAKKTLSQIAEHTTQIIDALNEKPAIIGHSTGGLLAEMLAGRGLSAATVAIDPGVFRGVLPLPFSVLKGVGLLLLNPLTRGRTITFSFDQFNYGWTNALDDQEARELYDTFHVGGSGIALAQMGNANINPWTQSKVDTKNPDRGPLLIIDGENDHTVPWAIANAAYKRQRRNPGVTEIVKIPNRGHSLTIDHGWREVAETALTFVERFAPGARPSLRRATVRHRLRDQHTKEGSVSQTITRSPIVLESASQDFVEATSEPPFLYELTPAEARKVLDDVQAAPIDKLQVRERWITVPADVGDVRVRIVRPPDAEGTLPVILYMHGGGWVLGNANTHDRLVRELAVGTGAAVAFVEYDRSPEARYPVAIEQGYATARWIVREGASHQLDPERVAVAGDSVGGNMTAALALMANERGDVRFLQQSMYYPVTDAGMDTASYEDLAEGYFLTAKGMAWFWDAYLPETDRRSEPFASPLRASDEQLTGLPPAFVIVDEADVLRDEGEAYAARLRAAGVAVTTVRYDGITHDFMMLNPLSETHATRAAVAQAISILRAVLQGA